VVTAVRRDIVDKVVIEARTDLADHPYFVVLDVVEQERRTRVVNCYDNQLGPSFTYTGTSRRTRRALEDIGWGQIIRGRCLILGDFNAHSPIWNAHAVERKDAGPLERLIDDHDLIVNNDPDEPIRPYKPRAMGDQGVPKILIIDLIISNQALGPLMACEIETEASIMLDHVMIWALWEPLEGVESGPSEKTVMGWQIRALIEDGEVLEAAEKTWSELSRGWLDLMDECLIGDVNREAECIEEVLIKVLGEHAKLIKLCARSKRWWNT
jgi:hypothetical protein